MIYLSYRPDLEEFYKYINKVHKTIKFVKEHSKNKIVFLDLIITLKEDGTTGTDICTKHLRIQNTGKIAYHILIRIRPHKKL